MPKPMVALIGRPNVGKSTLFNRLAEERLAVVDETPGTTRDRLLAEANWAGFAFDIVDTGGIDATHGGQTRNQHLSIGSAEYIQQIRSRPNLPSARPMPSSLLPMWRAASLLQTLR